MASFSHLRGSIMIRILLSIAVAAAAFFGPWFVEQADGVRTGARMETVTGAYFAGPTVDCVRDGVFSITGACAPEQGLEGQIVTAAIALGVASAVLNIFGLLPLVGRLTSLFAIVAGLAGVAALAVVGIGTMQDLGASLSDLRWGAYATGGFGVLLAIVGLGGLGGDSDD
jgi:hypothetical protein